MFFEQYRVFYPFLPSVRVVCLVVFSSLGALFLPKSAVWNDRFSSLPKATPQYLNLWHNRFIPTPYFQMNSYTLPKIVIDKKQLFLSIYSSHIIATHVSHLRDLFGGISLSIYKGIFTLLSFSLLRNYFHAKFTLFCPDFPLEYKCLSFYIQQPPKRC